MDRRQFIKSSGLVAGAALQGSVFAAASRPDKKRPNFLMITCHDLGQHLGCYGIKEVESPNIDRLASRGVRFANMFSTSAVCSPARGALHTGRYPQTNGLMGLTHAPWWWKFKNGETHAAQMFRKAGYDTCLCGLQHIFGAGEAGRYGYDKVLGRKKGAEETVQVSSEFLVNRKADDSPFFLKVGFFEVHRRGGSFKHREYDPAKPVHVPGYLADTPVMREDLGRFQEEIRYFDSCVGRILDSLQKSQCAENTIVVFTSDHGIPYPGAKWTIRDAGIEVPLIMYMPGGALSGGKVCDAMISHVDVLPTLLDMAEIDKPANLEGVSFADYLAGRSDAKPREEIFAQFTPAMFRDNESRCVRTEKYKLVRFFSAGRCVKYPIDVDPVRYAMHKERAATNWKPRPFVQLFDVQNDPDELNDIGGEKGNAEIVRDMSRKLYAWMKAVDDPILKGPMESPYYRDSMEDFENAASG
ncbi:Arylsulfatase [Anaerohalosphaera lusitana]|uniref:Arylsulfatase n=1 Tax=Anaerohalosphaera lusitana TaxID=1936003 RepID=A0A1U9NIB6_9BACT|nr:sulfatase [Anaerohalosphaera lusitana]AQT67661.1 Arylsulfatase [Anaerohalosphaera lusitana]